MALPPADRAARLRGAVEKLKKQASAGRGPISETKDQKKQSRFEEQIKKTNQQMNSLRSRVTIVTTVTFLALMSVWNSM